MRNGMSLSIDLQNFMKTGKSSGEKIPSALEYF